MIEIVHQYDFNSEQEPRPGNADQAQARLVQGNTELAQFWSQSFDRREAYREVISLDPGMWGIAEDGASVPPHIPFAAVLSCSDARVPTEQIFRQTANDLFVVRLAGNIISNEGVGSLAFAVRHLGESLKLLLVLGHEGCGAVTAAVDAYLEPANYPDVTPDIGLRSILDRIFVPVRVGARALDDAGQARSTDQETYRARLTQLSVVLNAAFTAMTMEKLLSDVIDVNKKVVFGVYGLDTHTVWAPQPNLHPTQWAEPGLATPPDSFAALQTLARQMAAVDE